MLATDIQKQIVVALGALMEEPTAVMRVRLEQSQRKMISNQRPTLHRCREGAGPGDRRAALPLLRMRRQQRRGAMASAVGMTAFTPSPVQLDSRTVAVAGRWLAVCRWSTVS